MTADGGVAAGIERRAARTHTFELVIDVTKQTVRVEVHDGAAPTAAFRELFDGPVTIVDANAANGRALSLMRSSAILCGLIDKDGGKVVWFEATTTNP